MRNDITTKAAVGDTLYLAEPYGWNGWTVSEWTVTRKTPKGQVVCKRGERELRLTPSGSIMGDSWSRRHFVTAEHAAELRADRAERDRWDAIATAAEELQKAARQQDGPAAREAFGKIAQGIEAATAGETA